MNRRGFLAGLVGVAGGLVLPEPPRVRTYSFMPGEPRHWVDEWIDKSGVRWRVGPWVPTVADPDVTYRIRYSLDGGDTYP